MKIKAKKRPFSLLEIMIVIFLIGLIGGTIGYNMKGSLDKGREFKTRESIRQVTDILLLQIAEGADMDDVVKKPEKFLKESGLVKDPSKLLLDGWGSKIEVSIDDGELVVTSKNLNRLKDKKKKR